MTSAESGNPTTAAPKKGGFRAFLATQFLGAFNDNVSKMLVICYGTAVFGADSPKASAFLSLAAACFILPYLLFSNFAGFLADRFRKNRVMVWTKVAEIVIMLLGFALAACGALYGLLAVLFCMGAQSAFFSPAKYGFLPETQPPARLPAANGATQLWTFLAIILGGWAGGALAGYCCPNRQVHLGFLFCVAIAALGTLASFFITRPDRTPDRVPFRLRDPISPHWKTFREIAKDRVLLAAFLGNTLFWFLGTVAQLVIVLLVKSTLQGGDQLVGGMQAALGLGIGGGCAIAGMLGRGKIPYWLVAPGGVAMGLALLLMGLLGSILPCAIALAVLAGAFGGCYQLPLSTAIQERSPVADRGRYIAAGNALDCISMMAGSALLWILRAAGMGPRGILAAIGAILLALLYPLCRKLR